MHVSRCLDRVDGHERSGSKDGQEKYRREVVRTPVIAALCRVAVGGAAGVRWCAAGRLLCCSFVFPWMDVPAPLDPYLTIRDVLEAD